MGTGETLGRVLADARAEKRWSLREVERRTGVANAHLSQIESGTIERPAPHTLWELAQVYGLDYTRLLRLAGHIEVDQGSARRSLVDSALRALTDLSPAEQQDVLAYMDQLRKRRQGGR